MQGFIKDKKQLEYTFPNNERIFDPKFTYAVAKRVSDIVIEENQLVVEVTFQNFQKAYMKFAIQDEILRFKFTQKQSIENRFQDHIKLKGFAVPEFKDNDSEIVVELSKNKKVIINKNPLDIKLVNKGKVLTSLYQREGYQFFEGYLNPPLGLRQTEKTQKPFISFDLQPYENIYGLGEKFNSFEKRGTRTKIWNSDNSCVSVTDTSYNALPLVYSSNNWGLLIDSGQKMTIDIASQTSDAMSILTEEEEMVIYFFIGNSMKDLITQYTHLTGRISGIPTESYGIWMSKLYYKTKEEALTELQNAKENDFPVDNINIDPKWLKNRYTKSCNFEINEAAFGKLEDFFKETQKYDAKVCFWINPYVQMDNSEFFKTAAQKGYLVKSSTDEFAHAITGTEIYQGNTALMDFTNPEATKWWKEHIKSLLKKGLRWVKPDYGDGVPEDALFFNGKDGNEMRQFYAYLYTKAAYEAVGEVYGKGEGLIFRRPGFIGSHTSPGKWGGDSYTRFQELKQGVATGLNAALSGEIMWGTDIGGFAGEANKELLIRWAQFGAFTTLTRFHGIGSREPWYFDATEQIRPYMKLKRQLIPYFKKYEKEAIETGLPIIRPLVLEYQNDMIARKIDDQFLIGEQIMVAPVLEQGAITRQVYFPEGEWVSFLDEETYQGNRMYIINADLDVLPIFVKKGCEIEMIENEDYKMSNYEKEKRVFIKY